MAASKKMTLRGRQFFALVLYFWHEAKKSGRRFRASRLLRAWQEEMKDGLSIKFTWEGQKYYENNKKTL